jgi:hypothetical protein
MKGPADPDVVTFHYRLEFGDGSTKEFEIRLDPDTLALVDPPTDTPPDWTRLDNHRCNNCPLAGKAEYCPVAVNLSHVVETFKESESFDEVRVTVTTSERTYQKRTSLQRGLSSIVGIYNVTSGCPVLDRLRPMVRFHLPFATSKETAYRAITMYLASQLFVMRRGGTPDWALTELARTYEAIADVETGLSLRFRAASQSDASVNAIIVLSVYGAEVRMLIDRRLHEIEHWFAPSAPQVRDLREE